MVPVRRRGPTREKQSSSMAIRRSSTSSRVKPTRLATPAAMIREMRRNSGAAGTSRRTSRWDTVPDRSGAASALRTYAPATIDRKGKHAMRRRLIALLALMTAALGTALALPAHAAVGGFVVVMHGSEERPALGDPDAIGVATLTLDSSTGQVCV